MKTKARIVFTVVGLITLAALIIPAFIPCNADRSQCVTDKLNAEKSGDCQLKTFECR